MAGTSLTSCFVFGLYNNPRRCKLSRAEWKKMDCNSNGGKNVRALVLDLLRAAVWGLQACCDLEMMLMEWKTSDAVLMHVMTNEPEFHAAGPDLDCL